MLTEIVIQSAADVNWGWKDDDFIAPACLKQDHHSAMQQQIQREVSYTESNLER